MSLVRLAKHNALERIAWRTSSEGLESQGIFLSLQPLRFFE